MKLHEAVYDNIYQFQSGVELWDIVWFAYKGTVRDKYILEVLRGSDLVNVGVFKLDMQSELALATRIKTTGTIHDYPEYFL